MNTQFSQLFHLRFPLVVGPMGGGFTTPTLVATTCNAGALGCLAGAYLNPSQLKTDILKTQSLTNRPFAVNLFTPMPTLNITESQIQNALRATKSYRDELQLDNPKVAFPYHEDFDLQMEAILSNPPKIFSFVFGLLDSRYMSELKRKNSIYIIGTATTLEEGLALEASGVNAIIAQGVEAGGHRAIFSSEAADPQISTMELTKLLCKHIKLPIIATGGIMNGKGMIDVLRNGAQAAQLGTAFLLTKEAGTSKAHRQGIYERKDQPTRLTRAFSGRLARGLPNKFMIEMEQPQNKDCILPFPAQNKFTRDIRSRATEVNNPDFLSLWAGTGVNSIRSESSMSASELVNELYREFEAEIVK